MGKNRYCKQTIPVLQHSEAKNKGEKFKNFNQESVLENKHVDHRRDRSCDFYNKN